MFINYLLDKAPRGKSKKMRRYEHVDLTKEFELRNKKREVEKLQKLEELYERHDRRALEMKEVQALHKQ